MSLLKQCLQRSMSKQKIRIVTPACLKSQYFGNVEAVPYDSSSFPNDGTTVYPAFQFEMPTYEELKTMGTMSAPEDSAESPTTLDEPIEEYSKKTTDFRYLTDDDQRSSVPFTLNSPAGTAALPHTVNVQTSRNGSLSGSDSAVCLVFPSAMSDSDSQDSSFQSDSTNSSLEGMEIYSNAACKYYLPADGLVDFGHTDTIVGKRKSVLSAADTENFGRVTNTVTANHSLPLPDDTSLFEAVNPAGSVESNAQGGAHFRSVSASTNGGTESNESFSSDSGGSCGTTVSIPRGEDRVYEKGALVYINVNASTEGSLPYWYPGEIVEVGHTLLDWQDEYTKTTAVSYKIKYVHPETVDSGKRKFYTGQDSKECLTAESFEPDGTEMREKVERDNAAFTAAESQSQTSRSRKTITARRRRGQSRRTHADDPTNPISFKNQKVGTRNSLRIRGKAAAPVQNQQQSTSGKDHRAIITRFRRKVPLE